MAIKTPSILPDLQKFVETLGADVPYDKLLGTAAEAGWQYRLVQREVLFSPEGAYMVTFDVQVGRDNVYEPLDSVTITVPRDQNRIYPVSLVARAQILPTLILLFFGRLPPQVQAPPPVEQTIDAGEGEGDITLDFDDTAAEPTSEAEDRGFTPDAYEPATPEPLDIIDHKEPDGVPIFKDLYSVGGEDVTADTIIAAVMEVIKPFSIRVSSKEELLALYTKNPDLNQFMIDFGTPEERLELKTVLDRALARLSEKPREVRIPGGTGSAAPRRRSPKA